MICTFKFYTARNQRIAAFARTMGDKLEILLLDCSAKDHFSKEVAYHFYSAWCAGEAHQMEDHKWEVARQLYSPKIFHLDLTTSYKTDFLEWMETNYYRKGTYVMRYAQPMLYQRRLLKNFSSPEGSLGAKLKEKDLIAQDPVINRTHWIGDRNIIFVGKGRVEATKLSMK